MAELAKWPNYPDIPYKETAFVCLLPKISKTIKPIVSNFFFFIRFLITPRVT